jgi:methionine salvage enolase-phosphatase E1
MDHMTIDHLLAISTLAEASDSLDLIAEELIGLHESWRARGAADDSLTWLGGLIGQLGWWSGRMTAAAFPDAASPNVPDGGLR